MSEKRHGQSLSEAVLLALSDADRPQRERAIVEAAETADPERLVGLIAVDDAVRRNAALEALSRGGQRSVPALLRALGDPDPEVVMFAANTLGKTRDLSAVPHLVRVLRHKDVNVCQAAIESLGLLRASSTLSALEELLGGDAWLRFSVVHTLGEIGHPSSVPTLVGLLGDKQVHDNAVDALGKIGGPEVIGELARLLETAESPRAFASCLNALGAALTQISDPAALHKVPAWSELARTGQQKIGPRLVEILRQSGGDLGPTDLLAAKEAAIDVIRCLRLQSCYAEMVAAAADERLGEAILFAAADIGTALGPYLTEAVAHQDRHVRLFACRALAAATPERAAGAISRLLRDPDDGIRAAAVRALGRLHCAEALPDIVSRLGDSAPIVRVAAIEALQRMDARAVTMALLQGHQVLSQQGSLVLSIMRENPHPAQRGFLEACVTSADEGIRQAAVAALAVQPGVDLAEVLEPLLTDGSIRVRREAIAALAARRGERARQLLAASLERDPETRADAISALRRIGDDRLGPRLVAVFPSCTTAEQALVVDTLGALEMTSAEPFLSRQLAHPDPNVRRHVVSALARIGNAPALRRLSAALRDADPRVRLAVSQALASCPHPIARNALERLSLDPVPSVAAAARAHIGR